MQNSSQNVTNDKPTPKFCRPDVLPVGALKGSIGTNGERKSKPQPANPGLPEKMAVKRTYVTTWVSMCDDGH